MTPLALPRPIGVFVDDIRAFRTELDRRRSLLSSVEELVYTTAEDGLEHAGLLLQPREQHAVGIPMLFVHGAGAILFLTGTTLLLGSWYGLVLVLLLTVAIAVRALAEERTLRAELPGYAAYQSQVKYHLIPFLW